MVLLSALEPLVLLLAMLVAMLVAMLSLAEPVLLSRTWREMRLPVGVVDEARPGSAAGPHCTVRKSVVLEPLPLRRFSAASVLLSPTAVCWGVKECKGGGGGGRGGGLVGQGLLISMDAGREVFRAAETGGECIVGGLAADTDGLGLGADACSDELGKRRMVGMCLVMVDVARGGTGGKRVRAGIDWVGGAAGGGEGDRTGTGAGRLGIKADAFLSLPPEPWSL